MGLRTLQIMGQAYSDSGDVSVTAIFDGVTVHNGVVPTSNAQTPGQNVARDVMVQFDVQDTLYNKTVASSFAVTGGDLFIAGIKGNNSDLADISAFNYLWQSAGQTPSKVNIKIDGVLVDITEAYGWHYLVPNGSTMTIDWVLPEAQGEVAGHVSIPVTTCVVGKEYKVRSPGTTDFTAMGSANNTPNTIFVCTAAGTGTGTARPTGK